MALLSHLKASWEALTRESPVLSFSVLKYDPDQPRAPKGSEIGGQWVATGDGAGDIEDQLYDPQSTDEIKRDLAAANAEKVFDGNEYAEPVYVTDDYVIEWNGEDLYPTITRKEDWIYSTDPTAFYPDMEEQFNRDFWESPPRLYHYTREENVPGIDRGGLEARAVTRGWSNRFSGPAVYTSTSYESNILGHYGEQLYSIDTAAMAADGKKPWVAVEPDVLEAEQRSALANLIRLEDFSPEVEGGMDYDTVVVYDDIPAKYLTRETDYEPSSLDGIFKRGDVIKSLFAKYSEDQPRAPKGTPGGGQWVATGAGKYAEQFVFDDLDAVGMTPNMYDRHRDPEYWERTRNMALEFTEISPEEYLQRGAEILSEFGSSGFSPEAIIANRKRTGGDSIKFLREAILSGKKIAALSLDYRKGYEGQEGMHRSLVAMELGIPKLPVMILRDRVEKYDPDQPRHPKGHSDGGQWRATGGKNGELATLAMDQKSRLQRARELGFDTDHVYYHGTTKDIAEFEHNGGKAEGEVLFLTSDRELAGKYARGAARMRVGANIMPLYIKKGLFKESGFPGYMPVSEIERLPQSEIKNYVDRVLAWNKQGAWDKTEYFDTEIARAKEEGYAGVIFREFIDDPYYDPIMGGWPSDVVAVIDPTAVRSTSAVFDPKEKDSAGVLKYDENQPRHPKGHPAGGQWRAEGSDFSPEGAPVRARLGEPQSVGQSESSESTAERVIRELNDEQAEFQKDKNNVGIRVDAELDLEPLSIEDAKRTMRFFPEGSMEDFVLRQGEAFVVPDSPPRITLGTPKECFSNAANVVAGIARDGIGSEDGVEYDYVEGFVQDRKLPFPIHHAWLSRKGTNEVVDPTLGWRPGSAYIGVKMTRTYLRKKLVENGYYGLFTDGIMVNPIVRGTDPDFNYKPEGDS